MNSQIQKRDDAVPRVRLLNCARPDCGATFTRLWRLHEHETTHTLTKPHKCPLEECGRSFSRRSHLRRHALLHNGAKTFRCSVAGCGESFFTADKLKRHAGFKHDKKDFFKCHFPQCEETFRKRRALKLHHVTHGEASFRCPKRRCGMKFESHIALKAHKKRHRGYRCPHADCAVTAHTWGNLLKHMSTHPVSFSCMVCKKVFRKRDALRRHKRAHALQKPVLLCPSQGCQAYFSTTFNLQHHIRKVHLQLLSHRCAFPGCTKAFAMRESLARHMLNHDTEMVKFKRRQKRNNKGWQKRLDGQNRRPLIEDVSRLFSLRMNMGHKVKREANLTGLFNERKIPHRVDPEANLRDLFSIRLTQTKQAERE